MRKRLMFATARSVSLVVRMWPCRSMARKAGPEGLGSRPVTTRWDRKGRTRLAVIDGLVNESVGFDQYERKEARQIAAPRPEPQL
jgi:hypothetical protein